MKKTVVIATFNAHKTEEIRAILPPLELLFRPLCSFPGASAPAEDGATLGENASAKAAAAAAFTGLPAMADDTGLEVDALGGAPGVRSARYAGEGCVPAENNARLLRELSGVAGAARRARFVCVVALAFPGGKVQLSEGRLEGRIAEAPSGAGGFGYDPLFEVEGTGLTLADLPPGRKNELSHRARALAGLLPELRRLAAAGPEPG